MIRLNSSVGGTKSLFPGFSSRTKLEMINFGIDHFFEISLYRRFGLDWPKHVFMYLKRCECSQCWSSFFIVCQKKILLLFEKPINYTEIWSIAIDSYRPPNFEWNVKKFVETVGSGQGTKHSKIFKKIQQIVDGGPVKFIKDINLFVYGLRTIRLFM